MKTVNNLLLVITLMITNLAIGQGTKTPILEVNQSQLKAIAEDEEAVSEEMTAFDEELKMEQFRVNLRRAYEEMKQAEEPEELTGSLL